MQLVHLVARRSCGPSRARRRRRALNLHVDWSSPVQELPFSHSKFNLAGSAQSYIFKVYQALTFAYSLMQKRTDHHSQNCPGPRVTEVVYIGFAIQACKTTSCGWRTRGEGGAIPLICDTSFEDARAIRHAQFLDSKELGYTRDTYTWKPHCTLTRKRG